LGSQFEPYESRSSAKREMPLCRDTTSIASLPTRVGTYDATAPRSVRCDGRFRGSRACSLHSPRRDPRTPQPQRADHGPVAPSPSRRAQRQSRPSEINATAPRSKSFLGFVPGVTADRFAHRRDPRLSSVTASRSRPSSASAERAESCSISRVSRRQHEADINCDSEVRLNVSHRQGSLKLGIRRTWIQQLTEEFLESSPRCFALTGLSETRNPSNLESTTYGGVS